MPLSARNNLDALYAQHRLLQEEAALLEGELDRLEADASQADRCYILDIESRALREEATKVGASISDILDRDLAR
jgi:prefoldin subunit 5